MKLKYIPFLLWYSLKEMLHDGIDMINMLRRAKTWSFIYYATMAVLIYYHKLTLTIYLVTSALILLVYFVRQKNEPEFNEALREKAFLKGDDELIRKYYTRYCKECFYSNRGQPFPYEEWKEKEIKKLMEQKNMSQESFDD